MLCINFCTLVSVGCICFPYKKSYISLLQTSVTTNNGNITNRQSDARREMLTTVQVSTNNASPYTMKGRGIVSAPCPLLEKHCLCKHTVVRMYELQHSPKFFFITDSLIPSANLWFLYVPLHRVPLLTRRRVAPSIKQMSRGTWRRSLAPHDTKGNICQHVGREAGLCNMWQGGRMGWGRVGVAALGPGNLEHREGRQQQKGKAETTVRHDAKTTNNMNLYEGQFWRSN